MAITTAQIQQLYVAYLGRAADKAGLDYWANELNTVPAKLTLENLRANFVNEQPEYKAIYGGLTRQDTVVKIYNNLFGRAPDADGLKYWTTGDGSTVNADQLLTAFVNGASATDSQVIANKVLVSEVYTSTAGDKFVPADAASIISGVTDKSTSITTALDKLTDGSLSGIAVPAAVAALKADAAADAAVLAYETNKLADISALVKELVALSTTGDKANLIGDVSITVGANSTYTDLKTAIDGAGGITKAQGTLDTKALTTTVAADTTALETARTKYLTDDTLTKAQQTAALNNINAYDAAIKAVAANAHAAGGDITQAQATFNAYAANSANTAEFTAAVKAAGLPDTTTSTDIYTTLAAAGTTDAKISAITSAFSKISSFASLKTVAATEHAANVADAALLKAEGVLTLVGGTATAWQSAYDKLADDTASLNASKAVDAFVAKYDSLDNAYNALTKAALGTQDVVDHSASLTKAVAPVAGVAVGTDAKADVFYFQSKIAQTDDFAINFGAKDTLYLGEGYTLGTGTLDAATGHINGGNNNALEVFFVKDGNDVKAIVETTAFGSSTAAANAGALLAATSTDNVAVITLTGVTDVSQVTFANGVISHVA